MPERPIDQVVRNIDARLSRVQQILPMLVCKSELHEAIGRAVSQLATRADLAAAAGQLATKIEHAGANAPFSTCTEPVAASAPPAGSDFSESLLAAASEIRAGIHEEGERIRRHFDLIAERLQDSVQRLLEEGIALRGRIDDLHAELEGGCANLDCRPTRTEPEHFG